MQLSAAAPSTRVQYSECALSSAVACVHRVRALAAGDHLTGALPSDPDPSRWQRLEQRQRVRGVWLWLSLSTGQWGRGLYRGLVLRAERGQRRLPCWAQRPPPHSHQRTVGRSVTEWPHLRSDHPLSLPGADSRGAWTHSGSRDDCEGGVEASPCSSSLPSPPRRPPRRPPTLSFPPSLSGPPPLLHHPLPPGVGSLGIGSGFVASALSCSSSSCPFNLTLRSLCSPALPSTRRLCPPSLCHVRLVGQRGVPRH